jgi:hypothetical protein
MRQRAIGIGRAEGLSRNAFAVFACASGSQELWAKAWDGDAAQWLPSQPGWTSLGGQFSSTVTSVIRDVLDPAADEIFGLGPGYEMSFGEMQFSFSPTPGWPPLPVTWAPVGGTFNGPPAASWYGADVANLSGGFTPSASLVVVGLGTDNQAYASVSFLDSEDRPTQTGWVPLGGKFISELLIDTASAADLNKFAVLGVQADAQLYRLEVDATNWPPALSGWVPAGGCFRATPAAASWGPSRFDVFGLGSDLAMYHQPWVSGAAQGGWVSLGGEFDSPPAVVSWEPGRLDIFGLGTDDAMYHKAWNGSQWLPSPAGWEQLGKPADGAFSCAPAVASYAAGRLDILCLGTDDAMYHKAWNGSQWLPSPAGWESLGGQFTVPRPTVLPGSLDLSSQVTFSDSTALGGSVDITLFSDGTYNFSGHMHDSGAVGYNYSVVCAVLDTNNRAYYFAHQNHVSGTLDPGSRDDSWGGLAGPQADIAANWNDFFGCGGAQLKWSASTTTDLTNLIASFVFPGVLVIDVTSK